MIPLVAVADDARCSHPMVCLAVAAYTIRAAVDN